MAPPRPLCYTSAIDLCQFRHFVLTKLLFGHFGRLYNVSDSKAFNENSNTNEEHHYRSSWINRNASSRTLLGTGHAGKAEPDPVEGDEGCNWGFGKGDPQTEGVPCASIFSALSGLHPAIEEGV